MFEWDRHNLRKIRGHGLQQGEVEEALSATPILIYEQDASGGVRYVYCGETKENRMIAVVLTERDEKIRVITAYDLDAGQKRDYLARRAKGE
ncbi:MAG TPA: BrnT family toxin [Bryobacteraceae bacterium]